MLKSHIWIPLITRAVFGEYFLNTSLNFYLNNQILDRYEDPDLILPAETEEIDFVNTVDWDEFNHQFQQLGYIDNSSFSVRQAWKRFYHLKKNYWHRSKRAPQKKPPPKPPPKRPPPKRPPPKRPPPKRPPPKRPPGKRPPGKRPPGKRPPPKRPPPKRPPPKRPPPKKTPKPKPTKPTKKPINMPKLPKLPKFPKFPKRPVKTTRKPRKTKPTKKPPPTKIQIYWHRLLLYLGFRTTSTTPKPTTTTTPRSTRAPYPLRGWIHRTDTRIPPNAFVGWIDWYNNPIYIGRARIPNTTSTVIPGTINRHEKCVRITWGKVGRCVRNHDILIGSFRWVPVYNASYHPDSVIGGVNGKESQRICRKVLLNRQRLVVLGRAGWTACYSLLPDGRTDVDRKEFELLVGNAENIWQRKWNVRTEYKDIRMPGEATSESKNG